MMQVEFCVYDDFRIGEPSDRGGGRRIRIQIFQSQLAIACLIQKVVGT